MQKYVLIWQLDNALLTSQPWTESRFEGELLLYLSHWIPPHKELHRRQLSGCLFSNSSRLGRDRGFDHSVWRRGGWWRKACQHMAALGLGQPQGCGLSGFLSLVNYNSEISVSTVQSPIMWSGKNNRKKLILGEESILFIFVFFFSFLLNSWHYFVKVFFCFCNLYCCLVFAPVSSFYFSACR